jgi:hypothetical protein
MWLALQPPSSGLLSRQEYGQSKNREFAKRLMHHISVSPPFLAGTIDKLLCKTALNA